MGLRVNGCCCCTLRTAGIIHGWIGIVIFIWTIINGTNRIINYDPNERPIDPYSHKPQTPNQEIIYLVLSFCDVLISGLLIIGITKNKHYMLLPWLILRAIGLMTAFAAGIIIFFLTSLFASSGMIIVVLIYSSIVALFVWSWIVIYSLYLEIRDTVNKPLPMPVGLPYYESQSGPVYPAPPYQEIENKIYNIPN